MTRYGLKQTTPPTEPAITLAEARSWVRGFPGDGHESTLEALVAAATDHVETETHRQLMPSTWTLTLPAFPSTIKLPRPPLVSVTEIKYWDGSTFQTLDPAQYVVANSYEPGMIWPVAGGDWPETEEHPEAVSVEYQAGYASRDVIPQGIRQAMLLMVAHWFEHRESVAQGTISPEVPLTSQRLIQNFQVGEEFLTYGVG